MLPSLSCFLSNMTKPGVFSVPILSLLFPDPLVRGSRPDPERFLVSAFVAPDGQTQSSINLASVLLAEIKKK